MGEVGWGTLRGVRGKQHNTYKGVSMQMVAHFLEKAMAPTPVLLPGTSHGQRSLLGCSPWGC